MLDTPTSRPTPADRTGEFYTTGFDLAYRLRGASPSRRVRIALQLISGEMTPKRLTVKQAVALTGASLRQVNQRRHEVAGKPLSEVRKERVVERLLDRILEQNGTDQILRRLDELTRPIAAE